MQARAALDTRLAQDAEHTAEKIATGTAALVTQTDTLIKLTRRVCGLTVVLIVLGLFEVARFILGLLRHQIQ